MIFSITLYIVAYQFAIFKIILYNSLVPIG